ncbi:methyl-accepting chemotaxis protein [Alicyclobacillus acidiphilus]|uniref:methyl-accepting chemotaxis protein n=1 Tax=Alicyclobacillus acidiphilus TaxID=182455 RepID=UPI0009F87576|nr:HAMP domain-containing methyl-accepting chemotaxis protein [Alicyclobacillus acidiphilus]
MTVFFSRVRAALTRSKTTSWIVTACVGAGKVAKRLGRFLPGLKIRQKFMVNTALTTVLIIAIGITNWAIVQRIHTATVKMENAASVLDQIRTLDYDISSVDDDGAIYLLDPTGPEASSAMQDYKRDGTKVQQDLSKLQRADVSKQDKAILSLFDVQWQPVLQENELSFQSVSSGLASVQSEYTQNSIQPLLDSLVQFTNDEQAAEKVASREVINLIRETVIWDVIISLIAIAIGFGGSWLLSVIITTPILRMRKMALEISKGNLRVDRVQIESEDELADLGNVLNQLAENLKTLILGIAQASEHVAASSQQLSASADEMMHATEEIATSIEQVAAGAATQMEEITQTSSSVGEVIGEIDTVTALTQVLSENAQHTREQAGRGTQMMESMESQMGTIRDRAGGAADLIAQLSEKSSDIRHIVETIASIADQTNLLALNAAIEAARAGEHGRGFGVVADEVRNLARGSADAAREVTQIIGDLIAITTQTVQSIGQVTSEVEAGSTLAASTRETFQRITESMDDVNRRVEEVTRATSTIAKRAADMSSYMEHVVHLAQTASDESRSVVAAAQTQSGSMEEIAATANSLSQRAQELQALIGRFEI